LYPFGNKQAMYFSRSYFSFFIRKTSFNTPLRNFGLFTTTTFMVIPPLTFEAIQT